MNNITTVEISDVPALAALVNGAYRGDSARQGWTHESDLIVGGVRTDAETLQEMLARPDAVMLKYCDADGAIQGCVYLHCKPRGLYLGMLSVNPALQGHGIGKQFLAAAAERARALGCACIYLTVISVRTELIEWYQRHGFALTGEREPFISESKFGVLQQALEFVYMERKV